MKQQNLERNITDNLAYYRKAAGYTQLEIAEKLSYSDKAISKWERGESYPDIFVLKKLADLYGITVNDFYRDKPRRIMSKHSKRRLFTSLIIAAFIYLVAAVIYVIFILAYQSAADRSLWIIYVYALVPLFTVLLILYAAWHDRLSVVVAETFLIWSLLAAIYLSFIAYGSDSRYLYLIFIIGIPLQLLALLQYFFRWTWAGAVEKVRTFFNHPDNSKENPDDEHQDDNT